MTFSNSTYLQPEARKVSACREALPQILAVSIKNILLIGFGMTLGFPTILVAGLSDLEETIKMNQEELSWIGSINLICVPLGCLLSGPLSQKFGRKRMMQVANIPLAATWLLFKFSATKWQIYLGLGIIGLLLGCIEAPVITYVAEITTPKLRGILSSTSTLSTIFGIMLQFTLGSFVNWRNAALFSFIVPILSLNLLILIPESPIWLVSQNRFLDARKSLAWLRGWLTLDDIDCEFRTIYKDNNQTFLANLPIDDRTVLRKSCTPSDYFSKKFMWPFGVITLVFFLRHFTGMTNVQTYAVELFALFKAPIDKYNATVILGCVELVGCLICVSLVRSFGKRKLTLITMLLSILCLLGVAMHTNIYNHYESWVPSGCLLGFALFSHAGLRILPWMLTGEVYTNETRAIGSGISAGLGYVFGFVVNKLFYVLLNGLGISGLFYFYAGVSFVGMILLYYLLPETEGKTLAEISEYFSGNKGVNVHNRRQSEDELYFTMQDINDDGTSYKRFNYFDSVI